MHQIIIRFIVLALVVSMASQCAGGEFGSITDTSIGLPTWEQFRRVAMLDDYNTRVVVIGTTLLGVAAGTIGTFLLLRKRALMGDAVSHATLPGIGIAFIVMTHCGGDGKWLPGLLVGAFISGFVGMGMIIVIRKFTRLKEDTALGIVLSVFFGLGIAILGMIQKMRTGHAAGLESFIYGKTASMLASDATWIGVVAVVVLTTCALFYKEFAALCFDPEYAQAQGYPVLALDVMIMVLVVTVTVIGLQAVGLILVIALLITPPAAARFWSNHLLRVVIAAAVIGAVSGYVGASVSALTPRLPAGAIIVLVAATLFLFSMIFGTARGVCLKLSQQWALWRKIGRQHLLRALYEWFEKENRRDAAEVLAAPHRDIPWEHLLPMRSWSSRQLRRLLRWAKDDGLLVEVLPNTFRLTDVGMAAARQVVRNHRLWEIYLITHADIAPSRVDRDADQIEHVLGPDLAERLEQMLLLEHPHLAVPTSPHPL